MTYTAPPTWTPDQIVSAADLNTYLTANLNYLWQRPKVGIIRNNGGTYTTTATSRADIDGTNLKAILQITNGAILAGLTVTTIGGASGYANDPRFDLDYNGVKAAPAYSVIQNNSGIQSISMTWLLTGLTPGSYTLKPQWFVPAGTGAIQCSANSPVIFWAAEI